MSLEKSFRMVLVMTSLWAGCGEEQNQSCTLADPTHGCGNDQICEEVGGKPACAAPLVVEGRVSDLAGAAIPGAIVTAVDANDAPTSGTATSGPDGRYQLRVPAPRAEGGAPLSRQIKLRAAGAGFDAFPSGLQRALPLELSGAVAREGKLVLAGGATDLMLAPGQAGLGAIAGRVLGDPGKRGVVVVAEGPVVVNGISDADGAFVLFNVPAGAYTVRGYAAGVQLAPAMVTVTAGARATGIDLAPRPAQLGSVSGSVSIVNAPGGSMTSVVLVVAATFNQALARGQVPPGLRAPRAGAPSVSGPFNISDVPDGNYVVLAAFENDGLVRDPDTAIGGTQLQRVTVEGGAQVTLSAGFKITEGLTVMQPGAGETPDVVMGPPTFVWKDDSSEDRYSLEVIDSHGASMWRDDQIPRATGGDVSVTYGGPPLARGLYQFRVVSFRRGDVPISATEDLRGVFVVP
ncbi:MAG TPA: hypothetical protein VN914_14065 [Polyangia bacterium]|nr:hypothetical protein [Polyangia bacterium]